VKIVKLKTIVEASEIAEYVYCKRAWWLNRSNITSVDLTRLNDFVEGNTIHSKKFRKTKVAIKMQYVGFFCVITSIGVLMFLVGFEFFFN
tara:strand:+ start:392 stop:661 length:270 start_codon:yes stop_codon:yes gene_type:complete